MISPLPNGGNKGGSDRSSYAFKSHCIHHNLYGVDIDASAVEICKLRLWLSLVVDEQRIDVIEPLPNLDYKIVRGNSLLGYPYKPMGLDEIEKLKEDYFIETDKKRKIELKEKIDGKIANLFKNTGKNLGYRANFDFKVNFSEVFREKDGFDVVIGNPPYGATIKGKYRKATVSFIGKVPDYEIYYFFIDLSAKLLKNNGSLSYIIPNTFLFNVFAEKYRVDLLRHWQLNEILDCTDFQIFEATVRNAIINFIKTNNSNKKIGYRYSAEKYSFEELISTGRKHISEKKIIQSNNNWALAFRLPQNKLDTILKIREENKPLIYYFPELTQGLIAYDKYRGQSKEIIEDRKYHFFEKTKKTLKPWLWGEDVKRYSVIWNKKEYIDYCSGIANPRQPKFFKGERVLIREITNPSIYAAYTDLELYSDPSVITVLKNNSSNLFSLLGILNSKLASFYHFNSSPKATKDAFPKILIKDIKNFPFPKLPVTYFRFFEILTKYLIHLNTLKNMNIKIDSIIISHFEQLIDGMVFELYFEDEVKKAGREILKYLTDTSTSLSTGLTPITDDMSDEQKMEIITKTFNELYDKNHPVRQNLEGMDEIEEVRIIKGLDK